MRKLKARLLSKEFVWPDKVEGFEFKVLHMTKMQFFDSPRIFFLLLNIHEIWRNGGQLANIVSGKI